MTFDPRHRRPGPGAGARAAAARVLVEVEGTDAFANVLLRRVLDESGLEDPRDRGLATELVYGVLRWQRRLDHALTPNVRRGLDRLEPIARVLLRLGSYQLLFLDRIPRPVAVSTTQDAARAVGAERLTGLLNGVLRRVAGSEERLPDGGDDRAIGLRTSLPDWVVRALREAYGDHALEVEARALRDRAAVTIRPSRKADGDSPALAVSEALAAEGFDVKEGPLGTLVVEGRGDPFGTRAFQEGLFLPQDPASLAVVDLVARDAPPDSRVLDLCAGRGVKATGLAERGLRVLAVDVEETKLAAARELALRVGVADRVETLRGDGTDPALDLGSFDRFDRILVDAPCTGLGTLRHHPEIAWRRRSLDVGRMCDLQARLLASAATRLEPGGLLVYAVCSFVPREGNPPVPASLVPEGDPLVFRPSDGVDAFQVRCFRRHP